MPETWIGQALLQPTVTGEQEQSFTVGIQTSCGINLRHVNEIPQTAPTTSLFRSELAEHPVGLVQQQGGQISRRFRVFSTD